MTKKDYLLIAEAIKDSRATFSESPVLKHYHYAIYDVALTIAERLEKENPRFDRVKFIQACGIAV